MDNVGIVSDKLGKPTKLLPVSSSPVSQSQFADDRSALRNVPVNQAFSAPGPWVSDHVPQDHISHDTPNINETHNAQDFQPIASEPSYSDPSKNVLAVQSYFCGRNFDGIMTQSIHCTIRDYEVCVKQLRLTAQQNTELFVNVLDRPVREFFLKHCRDDIYFKKLATLMAK